MTTNHQTYILHVLVIRIGEDLVYAEDVMVYPTVAGERRRRNTAVKVFPPLGPHLNYDQLDCSYTEQ